MLTTRRSPTGPVGFAAPAPAPVPAPVPDPARAPPAACAAAAGRGPACSGVAHSEQNFAVGGLIVPQLGQPDASGVAHSEQNLAPMRFSVAQFGQITGAEDTRGTSPGGA